MVVSKINMIAGLFRAFAFETISVTTVKSLTASSYQDTDGNAARRAIITVEAARISYRWDGGTPTSSVGHTANPNDVILVVGGTNIRNFKAIKKDSATPTLRITFER